MNGHNYDYLFKIVMVGDSDVGKTALLIQYTEQRYIPSITATTAIDFKVKNTKVESKVVKQQIWDTAGPDRFASITGAYYRGAHGILLCFDVSDRNSFNNINKWLERIEKQAPVTPLILLVGTKCDIEEKRQVSSQEAEELVIKLYEKNNNILGYMETSAKGNIDVADVFQYITDAVYQQKFQQPSANVDHSQVSEGSSRNKSGSAIKFKM